jgi:hypothetical protein
MIAPVEVPFYVMDRARAVEWKGIRMRFQRDAEDIKLATRDLIDTCFRCWWPFELLQLLSARCLVVTGELAGLS